MKKIYLKPSAEFEEIEESILYQASVESESVAPETGGQTQGPGGGTEVDDGSEFDW